MNIKNNNLRKIRREKDLTQVPLNLIKLLK